LTTAGIIANPASGKDIRRLVAYGSVFDNQEKVRIVRRVLLGLEAIGLDRIFYMPDYFGIVSRALSRIDISIPAEPLDLPLTGTQEDSVQAARMMADQGVGCIVTLGGDGTNRAVVKGNGSVPILPISTGTNNVFPAMVEGTVAGLAAGLIAGNQVPLAESTFAHTQLEVVMDGEPVDLALVDAVVYDGVFKGSKAVWELEKVHTAFLNRAQPENIGLSSLGGQLHPLQAHEPLGLCLELGKAGRSVVAPVAPGVIREVHIRRQRLMKVGEEIDIQLKPSVLALDGEREVEIRRDQSVAIRLAGKGPIVVDVPSTMRAATQRKILAPDVDGEPKHFRTD